MRFSLILLGILSCLIRPSLVDGAVVIDFESVANVSTVSVTSPYTEDGFNVAAVTGGLATLGSADPNFYAGGSAAMTNGFIAGVVQLTAVGGGGFDLTSIDLAELSLTAYPGAVSVSFTGTKLDNSLVTQSFSLDQLFGFQTFAFSPAFLGVKEVTWSQVANYHQFDNIVINGPIGTVPEPMTAIVWGGLILGAVVIARTRAFSNE